MHETMRSHLSAPFLLFALSSAWASGIDRSGQGLGALFENGNYVEVALNRVIPEVQGRDASGGRTQNVAGDYYLPSVSLKLDASERLALGFVFDQPYGGDLLYGASTPLFAGTLVDTTSHAILGLARYRFNAYFSVHGGIRTQRALARIDLKGLAYGPVDGYELRLDPDTASAPVMGLAVEYPAIALRLAITYHDAIQHRFKTRESAPLAPLNGQSTTTVTTPRAVNVDFQTGLTQDSLLFARLRWVKWSEFRVAPRQFARVTGQGLVDQPDTRIWTLGLVQQLTPAWAVAVSLDYEARDKPIHSPLAPSSGRKGITLAAIYTRDRYRVSAGIGYIELGDTRLGTGRPVLERARMGDDNHSLALGAKIGWAF